MKWTTTKTVFGFLLTLLRRHTPIGFKGESLAAIYNYREISERICTSGQPTENQFALIKHAGYGTVINLAPHDAENALDDESGALASLGLRYVHLPVDFARPSQADFERFVRELENASPDRTWIHCAANMRVSAFVYRYRRDVLGEAEDAAAKDLHAIWEPFGVWARFVAPPTEAP